MIVPLFKVAAEAVKKSPSLMRRAMEACMIAFASAVGAEGGRMSCRCLEKQCSKLQAQRCKTRGGRR